MTGPHRTDFAAPRPAWTRPAFVASAAVVAVVCLGGVVVALLPGDDPTPPRPPAATAPTTGQQPGETLPTQIPTTAPDDVAWQLVGSTAVPVSASAGPANVSTTAAGYDHSPIGALVAAAQLCVRSGHAAGRKVWQPTIEQQFVPGPDRDRMLAALDAAGDVGSDPGELSQIAGYQYVSYSPDTAVIGLVMRAPTSGVAFHVLTLTVRWIDGDWRMVPPPSGLWSSVNRQTTDLTGVVEWGAR